MIYQLSQVSNRDTQVLYFYRILRHSSTELSELYRYSNPDIFNLEVAEEIKDSDKIRYAYHLQIAEKPNRVPYLEFKADDEDELRNIQSLTEVEVLPNELVIYSDNNQLTEKTQVSVYWIPTLAFIEQLQDKIKSILGDLGDRNSRDSDLIKKLSVSGDYVLNAEGLIPNLVSIGEDEVGLIYDDSHYKLSGALQTQVIMNPTQVAVSSLLKTHIGTLEIHDNMNESKVYQGFHGGCIELSGKFRTLVLKDITSIVFLTAISAVSLIIDNCPAVMFRKDLSTEGSSGLIENLELRNSYVTVNQPITIDSVRCYRQSTLVQIKGSVNQIGFIEAGSNLVYDTPGSQNQIEEIRSSALQGLFYTSNPPEEMPYLDEVFLAQKPISFQRGQVEDPVPMSQAEVSIYLKNGSGPGPGPSPSGKIYSPFTSWYWSGDSRTVQLIAQTHTDGKGYGGESLPKLIEVQSEIETEGVQHNIILWWGVNGLDYGAAAYADVYKAIANTVGNNAMVFVGNVGHCPNGTGSGKVDGGAGQDLVPFNESIKQFNTDLATALSGVSNIHLLDIDSYIQQLEDDKGAAWLTNDNLHYKPEASQAIYDWVCNQITNVEPGDIPDAPTDTHAGVIWNWFKYAGIPNVSDRPELIAGVIGNCQQESYAAIDILGSKNGYYGPWCESNQSFYEYMTSRGFVFHPYTTTPGDASAAIPYAFTWLIESSPSWTGWLDDVIDQVSSQTGEAGARAYAELFCVCVERCINGPDTVIDPGVVQIMMNYYGRTYTYQDLDARRNNAAAIYRQFMGG